MAPEICPLHEFTSPSNPYHKIQYTLQNPSAPHTLLFCYGAGNNAVDTTRYQAYLTAHPLLSLLCIDRWTLPTSSTTPIARSGMQLLTDLTSITLELLDSLGITEVSIAAHSAGVYQMLDLAHRYVQTSRVRVKCVFPICTHIPHPFLDSRAMRCMTEAPGFLFDAITYLDNGILDSRVGKMYQRFFAGEKEEGEDGVFVDTKELRHVLSTHQPDARQWLLNQERHKLDYAFAYARLPGVHVDQLMQLYLDIGTWEDIRVIWFTCTADVFFGPEGVNRVVKEIKKNRDEGGQEENVERRSGVEVVIVEDASHADIFRRKSVWDGMYEAIVKVRGQD